MTGLGFSVDLEPRENDLVGYRAKPHTGLIDLDKLGHYPARDYWEEIRTTKGRIILDPGAFYILVSREAVTIPPDHAAEMAPYLAMVGEFRVHYAGFFDPGFGYAAAGGAGSRGVLEVRCHEAPFALEHGQVVGRLVYEKMSQIPKVFRNEQENVRSQLIMQNPVLLLTLTVGVIGANSLVLSPISASVAADLSGVSPADVMRASALYGLGVALSALTLAPQADRVGAGRALLFAMAGLAASLAGSAVGTQLVHIDGDAICVRRVCAGVAIPSAYSLAAQVSKPGQEAKTMGAVLTGWTLSMVGGVTLSALISEVVGWRMVFIALCALTGVLTLMLRTCDFGKSPATWSGNKPAKGPEAYLRLDPALFQYWHWVAGSMEFTTTLAPTWKHT
ncbi:putative MFS-type transporter YwfA [Nymphon striatum]|nr:putative MFS-type transporter YwfA [Nymphon striatum]